MVEETKFDWVPFYEEFARKLLEYEHDRTELIVKLEEIFARGIKKPKLEKDGYIRDVDPFTVFAIFNKSSFSLDNRLKIIAAFKEVFDIKAPLPTALEGVPLLFSMMANYYYYFGNRGEHDIDKLWTLFRIARELSEKDSEALREEFKQAFDIVLTLPGIKNPKATMGLFWVAPTRFLSLDRNNQNYLLRSGNVPKEVVGENLALGQKISGADYLALLDRLFVFFQNPQSPVRDFKELSARAYESIDESESDGIRYWIYAPGEHADHWEEFCNLDIMGLGWEELGDLSQYRSQNAINNKLRELNPDKSSKQVAHMPWQFANVIKPGDIVFAKFGRTKIIGRGVVTGEYEWDESRKIYNNVRSVEWTHKGEWTFPDPSLQLPYKALPTKTLTDYTPYTEMVESLEALFEIDDHGGDPPPAPSTEEVYDKDSFLSDVYMTEDDYDELHELLLHKQNLILQGAPGVGKTYAAKRLAYAFMGVKDPTRVMSVQFHQSYSYEDFIMGYRPTANGFELRYGAFYSFCKKAEEDPENPYFCVIDEINRGNISKIFGELFMLLESDKRGHSLQLLYANEKFSIPSNIYVIGTMNTADRSLAMIDYALRRRFAFFQMTPGFDSEGFKRNLETLNSTKFNSLISMIKELNDAIAQDDALGKGFCIGHSFFCTSDGSEESLIRIIRHEIVPLLEEYWFDETDKVAVWRDQLFDSIARS